MATQIMENERTAKAQHITRQPDGTGWRESFCFWRISAKKPRLSRSSGILVRKPLRK
jgi:hypothetical protein